MIEALFSAVAEVVIERAVVLFELDKRLQHKLKGGTGKIALQQALSRAYATFSHQYPELSQSLFTEPFLLREAAPELAKLLTRHLKPDPAEFARLWVQIERHHIRANVLIAEGKPTSLAINAAADFLHWFESELKREEVFQTLFDARALESLPAIEAKLDELNSGFQATLDANIRFAALSKYVRVQQFQVLINKHTQGFVGRDFIFRAIEDLLQDKTFPSGYIVISGEPGIGKSALTAQMVKQKGYVHHFNIRLQNINTARDFLGNVCAQLIVRYGLRYRALPEEATKDSGFLAQLLSEISVNEKVRPIVILVDALS